MKTGKYSDRYPVLAVVVSQIRPPDQVMSKTRRIYRLSVFGADAVSDLLWDDAPLRGILRQALVAAMTPPPTAE